MKKALIIVSTVFLSIFAYGQAIDTVNIYTFGGIQNESCNQVISTSDGGYITIGTTNSFGHGNTDFYVIKTDSNCKRMWSNFYGGLVNEEGYSVVQTYDKGFAFVGFTDSYGNGGYDVYLVRTDSNGKQLWQQTYGGSDWDFGYAIQQLPDSGFIISGLTYSYGKGNGDMYVIRTDKLGDTIWTRAIGDTGYDVGNAIYVQGDSLYTIVGASTSYNNLADTNGFFVQIFKNGTIKQIRNYYSLHNSTISSIEQKLDTGFFMYGRTDSIPDSSNSHYTSFEYALVTDKAGKIQAQNIFSYNAPQTGYGKDAQLISGGNFLTLGSNLNFGAGKFDFHMQLLTSNASYLNAYTFGSSDDELTGSISTGKHGDVVLGGSSDSPGWTCGLYDVCLVLLKKDFFSSTGYDTILHNYCDSLSPSGIPYQSAGQIRVRVYPNPVLNQANFILQTSGLSSNFWINIFNESGEQVAEAVKLSPCGHGLFSAIIQKGSLSFGDYIYVITGADGKKVANGKIIFE